MIEFEVMQGDEAVRTREVTPQGKTPFTVQYQDVYLHSPENRFPLHVQIDLKPNQGRPYQVGRYTLSPESIRVTPYKSIEINRFNVILEPIETPKK